MEGGQASDGVHAFIVSREEAVGAGRFEGGRIMFDSRGLRLVSGPPDGDDIKSAATVEQLVAMQISQCGTGHASLLVLINAFGRMTGLQRSERFDFDEREQSTASIGDDQVDLAAAIRFTVRDNRVATHPQMASGSLFTPSPKRRGMIDDAIPPVMVGSAKA